MLQINYSVEVKGPFACFTRPEFGVERVSYEVMTPSAARGFLDAIYWHPGLKWVIDRIHVCSPIRYLNATSKELKAGAASCTDAVKAMKGEDVDCSFYTAATADMGQLRSTRLLRDVHYVIDAHFTLDKEHDSQQARDKVDQIMTRRLKQGKCFAQPYFGMKEFPGDFQKCEVMPECPDSLRGERNLGWMLYDMDFSDPYDYKPMFFHATMRDGVVDVPAPFSKDVLRV